MKLFGGAITAELPSTLVDASDLREVPDNQEVFVGVVESFDVSLIIELLEMVPHPNVMDALNIHVEEAHRMAGTAAQDREEPMQVQLLQLGKHLTASRTDIVFTKEGRTMLVFALVRLEEYETDVLITCTLAQAGTSPSEKELGTQTAAVFKIAETLEVKDPRLFNSTPHEAVAQSASDIKF